LNLCRKWNSFINAAAAGKPEKSYFFPYLGFCDASRGVCWGDGEDDIETMRTLSKLTIGIRL
jgi:hypothetical protein